MRGVTAQVGSEPWKGDWCRLSQPRKAEEGTHTEVYPVKEAGIHIERCLTGKREPKQDREVPTCEGYLEGGVRTQVGQGRQLCKKGGVRLQAGNQCLERVMRTSKVR